MRERAPRRHKIELMREILEAFQEKPLKITEVMRASNLPHNRAKPLCFKMAHKGLLENEKVIYGNGFVYVFKITEKGLKMRAAIRQLLNAGLEEVVYG